MNGFWWLLIGFAAATGLSIWWYRGMAKEWLDNQKQKIRDKL